MYGMYSVLLATGWGRGELGELGQLGGQVKRRKKAEAVVVCLC